MDGTIQQALYGGHLPPPTNQSGLRTPDSAVLVSHGQQPLGGDGFIRTLDAHHLRLTQSR